MKKEVIHVEIENRKKLSAKMCCTPGTLMVMIAAMIKKISEDRDDVSIRDMLIGIIWLTDPEVVKEVEKSERQKVIDQMIDNALREMRDGRTD